MLYTVNTEADNKQQNRENEQNKLAYKRYRKENTNWVNCLH